jgi:hypothetical protein
MDGRIAKAKEDNRYHWDPTQTIATVSLDPHDLLETRLFTRATNRQKTGVSSIDTFHGSLCWLH